MGEKKAVKWVLANLLICRLDEKLLETEWRRKRNNQMKRTEER